LNRQHHENHRSDPTSRGRHRRGARGPGHHHSIPLTEDGVPAATPDAPKPSPVVFVSEESRARYPWLPGRVIAGSVWRGPLHERVRVDESGNATPWRCGPAVAAR
jgi:hypothetical protein